MANLSKLKRDKMITYLDELKKTHIDDNSIIAINEIENALRNKKFGLVFEEHEEEVDQMLKDNLPIFNEDKNREIRNGSSFSNFIIEGDNLQALYLLEKTHRGKIDCIYIDPPYNTGAHDWKYNNDYVDEKDSYRHSKWLSMMKNRLLIAKTLLRRDASVLICTIDEKEFLHIGCLLEELFPEANIQMVSTIIKPEGTQRANEFSRTNEFIFFVMIGKIGLKPTSNNMFDSDGDSQKVALPWRNLRRRENRSTRENCPNQFYPFFLSKKTGYIVSIGDAVPSGVNRDDVQVPEDCFPLFPLTPAGKEMTWGCLPATAKTMFENGYLMSTNGLKGIAKAGIKYLLKGVIKDIEAGLVVITGHGQQGEIEGYYDYGNKSLMPKTIWNMPSHNAQVGGSLLIKNILGDVRFPYPKSLYAVHDTIRFFVGDKPNSTILDFFAGSGTTLHAVNLLNSEDGGHRKCIVVTNNEVSEDDAKSLKEQGFKPGDDEWERLGIARYVTWPRTRNSIFGCREDGTSIKGEYETFLLQEEFANRSVEQLSFFNNQLTDSDKYQIAKMLSKDAIKKKMIVAGANYVVPTEPSIDVSILFNSDYADEWIGELEENQHITKMFVLTSNKSTFNKIKDEIENTLEPIIVKKPIEMPISNGFKTCVKYFKCDWTTRKPADYLLSNALCLHIKEMLEIQNFIEIDNVKNILVLNKKDYTKFVLNGDRNKIKNIWVNQNIIFSSSELDELKRLRYKTIPKEFFGEELKEAGE